MQRPFPNARLQLRETNVRSSVDDHQLAESCARVSEVEFHLARDHLVIARASPPFARHGTRSLRAQARFAVDGATAVEVHPRARRPGVPRERLAWRALQRTTSRRPLLGSCGSRTIEAFEFR